MELKELVDRHQHAMNTIYRRVNAILKEKIHADITTDQFSTLHYIFNHEKCTSTEIANAFGIGKSAVTAQVTRLFDKGLVERTGDENDRRIIYLSLTHKGIHFVQHTEKKLHEALGGYLAHFDWDEIHTFILSLEKLAKVMEE